MDDRLDKDLYRENIRVAPLVMRAGAYIIDLLIIAFVLTMLITPSQKQLIDTANHTITKAYSATYSEIQLQNTPDNSAALEDLRIALKQALDVLLMYFAICFGLQVVYNFIFLYFYGATLGQIIVRLKVVDISNFDRPQLHTCMKRSIIKCIFGAVFYVGFIVALFNKHHRALHDKMSRTIVVCV